MRHNYPLSHTADPETSYEAADRMVKSGKLSRQEQDILDTIIDRDRYHYKYPDFTAKDLVNWNNSDYYTIQRRLSGLCNKGKIERTGERRNGCCVWRLI